MPLSQNDRHLIKSFRWITILCGLVLLAFGIALLSLLHPLSLPELPSPIDQPKDELWMAPDTSQIPKTPDGDRIRYGKKLITQTSRFLGPKGTVRAISNGMNCQNCHLEAGTKPYGNNYGSVASLYPKFRDRSNSFESIEKRVNDCIQRSLNGEALDSLSTEMKAIVTYIEWLGKNVTKGEKAKGAGLIDITYLDRPADSLKGHQLYAIKCSSCHGSQGEGIIRFSGIEYLYPPLWGEHSFNTGAGLYRISNFAKYIRANMPQGATYDKPQLTEEEAWDISAYVLSMSRPEKTFAQDWPKMETKPIDHPFGPYADEFDELQHKYGPFKPIISAKKSN